MDKDLNEKAGGNKKLSFSCGCMSWPAVFLSVAIIAVRAFQPNALPMHEWSAMSWFLMLLPTFIPALMWIALLFLSAIGAIAYEACR